MRSCADHTARRLVPRSGQGAYSQAPTNWTGWAPHWDLKRNRLHRGWVSSLGKPGASWLSTPLMSYVANPFSAAQRMIVHCNRKLAANLGAAGAVDTAGASGV